MTREYTDPIFTNEEIAADMGVPVENVVEAKRLMDLLDKQMWEQLHEALNQRGIRLEKDIRYRLFRALDRLLEGSGVRITQENPILGRIPWAVYLERYNHHALTVVSYPHMHFIPLRLWVFRYEADGRELSDLY